MTDEDFFAQNVQQPKGLSDAEFFGAPNVSQVAQPDTTPIIPRSGAQMESLGAREFLQTAPGQVRGTGDQPVIPIPRIPQQQGVLAQLGAGAVNIGASLAEIAETPQLFAALPVAPAKLSQVLFGGQALSDIKSAYQEASQPGTTIQKGLELGGRALTDAIFGVGMVHGAVGEFGTPRLTDTLFPRTTEVPTTPEIPLTEKAVQQQGGEIPSATQERIIPQSNISEYTGNGEGGPPATPSGGGIAVPSAKVAGQEAVAPTVPQPEQPLETFPVSTEGQPPQALEQPKPEVASIAAEPAIPNSPTSLKNAVVDQERTARGLPSVVQPARQGFGELWDRVSQKIDQDPNYPDQVIESLRTNNRAMTAEEDAALLHRQVDLQNQYQKANQGVIDAKASGDDTALSEASAQSRALSDQLLEIYDIGRAGGRETALGLNARKLLANEDFSLGNMITQKRADKLGAELTPKEISQVTKQYNQINANRIALDAYETSPRAEAYRKQLQKWTKEYRQKTAAGDFSPKIRQPLLLDAQGQKIKAEFERSKADWQRARVADQAANRTTSQKFWDRFVGVERAMKLSSDVVLAKLTAAAAVREAGLTPAEQAVGSVTRQIVPGIAAKAPRYGGGFSLDSEINAKREMFTTGMKDAWQNLKMKQTDLDELYKTGKIKAPDEFYDYMGYLHGALKAPIKRAEFARSLTERMKWAARNGQDLNSQPVMRQLSEQAYVDANRSIFLQDNIVSKSMNLLNRYLETQKIAPNLGPALSRINRFLVPIVKIPTNIVGEVAEGVHGVASGGTRAALAYMKGLSSLEPAQADLIMRQINKGLIGNALILTGYLLRNNVGGFYHNQDKRAPADVQPGRYRIGSVDLPASAGHSTGAMLLNIGATVGRVAEEQIRKSGSETKGVGEGIRATGAGLAHEVPFVPAITGITDAMDSKGGFQKYINGMITSTTTPALLSHIAKIADTPGTFPQNVLQEATKRKPTTPVEALKMGIPGLRQQVPEKPERKSGASKVSKFGGVVTQ